LIDEMLIDELMISELMKGELPNWRLCGRFLALVDLRVESKTRPLRFWFAHDPKAPGL